MAGGIGDFNVSVGKDSARTGNASAHGHSASPVPVGSPRRVRVPGQGNSHYIILMKKSWEQDVPLKFHNGYLDDLRNRLSLSAKVPLPEMPNFFPSGAEGEISFQGRHVLHVDSALRDQPLFSHLETLKVLVQKCADRKTTFPEFVEALNRIPIPSAWRNEIVNGLFENAQPSGPIVPPASKQPGQNQDIDKLLELLNEKDTGGSRLSPHLGRFLEEVGRDSTGFTLRDGAARDLLRELDQTLDALRSSLLRQASLAETLGFIASLQRLARTTKGRERQCVHLWSGLPADPGALLTGENADAGEDFAVAVVLLDPWERDAEFLRQVGALAGDLGCPVLAQVPAESIPSAASLAALSEKMPRGQIFCFGGGVASRVEEEACVFRPAALAFLEGLVASRQNVEYFLHRSMVLEDQDLITEKSQARSTDRLLDQAQITALSAAGINRVNGARNQSVASFPLLTAWIG